MPSADSAAAVAVQWTFSGKSQSYPPPRSTLLAALAIARGDLLTCTDARGVRRANVRDLMGQHIAGNGVDMLVLAGADEATRRRLSGDRSAAADPLIARAMREAIAETGNAERRYAAWAVALALQNDLWLIGHGRAVWTADQAWSCRPATRTAREEAQFRHAVEARLGSG